MGGGASSKKSKRVEETTEDTVCILGTQGSGKSTIMKQFRNGSDGESLVRSAEVVASVKNDILRAVAVRTRVLTEHICTEDEDVGANTLDLVDDFYEAERDFISFINEVKSRGTGSLEYGIRPKNTPPKSTASPEPRSLLSENRQKSFCTRSELRGHKDEASRLLALIVRLWKAEKLAKLNADEHAMHKIVEMLQSAEKEQLFLAGGYFVAKDIAKVMHPTYDLTHSDYCHSRSWTQDYSEAKLKIDDRSLILRDVGGDEVNRVQHWETAVQDSFCVLFVVSLSDYTKRHKLHQARHLLWMYLIGNLDGHRPKIILLLNKQDLFSRRLELSPLHTSGIEDFEHEDPANLDVETHAEYVDRCQDAIVKFFKHLPSSVKESSKYKELKKGVYFDREAMHISDVYLTQATDEHMFANIKDELYGVFAETLKDMLTAAF